MKTKANTFIENRVSGRHTRTQKRIKGATKVSPVQKKSSLKWGRIVISLFMVSAGVFGLASVEWQSVFDRAANATNRPLAHIKIEGEFRFVAKQDLVDLISPKLNGSFVDLDLKAVKKAIEENPWVESVTIERVWPDSLKLSIKEQRAIARWNNDGFINQEGRLIKVKTNEILKGLPLLSGQDIQSQEMAKHYVKFSDLLKVSELRIADLSVDDKHSWSMRIENAFDLVLGSDDVESRLKDFVYVYDTYLYRKRDEINRIDMRYERGLAVDWKEQSPAVALHATE